MTPLNGNWRKLAFGIFQGVLLAALLTLAAWARNVDQTIAQISPVEQRLVTREVIELRFDAIEEQLDRIEAKLQNQEMD